MKLRIYPKTETVKDLLQARLDDANNEIFDLEAKLETLQQSRLVAVNGDQKSLATLIELRTQMADRLTDELVLLHSHSPSEVMVELDIG